MVTNDACYHAPCMNTFKATRIPTQVSQEKTLFDEGFHQLTEELKVGLFKKNELLYDHNFEEQVPRHFT